MKRASDGGDDKQTTQKEPKIVATRACASCRRLKKACDNQRPCSRCVKAGRVCSDEDPVQTLQNFAESLFGKGLNFVPPFWNPPALMNTTPFDCCANGMFPSPCYPLAPFPPQHTACAEPPAKRTKSDTTSDPTPPPSFQPDTNIENSSNQSSPQTDAPELNQYIPDHHHYHHHHHHNHGQNTGQSLHAHLAHGPGQPLHAHVCLPVTLPVLDDFELPEVDCPCFSPSQILLSSPVVASLSGTCENGTDSADSPPPISLESSGPTTAEASSSADPSAQAHRHHHHHPQQHAPNCPYKQCRDHLAQVPAAKIIREWSSLWGQCVELLMANGVPVAPPKSPGPDHVRQLLDFAGKMSQNCVIVCEADTLSVFYINEAFSQQSGYARASLLGQPLPLDKMVHPACWEMIAERARNALFDVSVTHFEVLDLVVCKASGRVENLMAKVEVMRDEKGVPRMLAIALMSVLLCPKC